MAFSRLLTRSVRLKWGSLSCSLNRCSSTFNFDGDFVGPVMKTPVPGPKSKVGVYEIVQ